jgi:tRNA pseudouridine55 synthase
MSDEQPRQAAGERSPAVQGQSRRRERLAIDGVLLIDKPSGITSTAALARAKRALDAKKAGHTGTLDPLASGLLPLCFGEATKFAADLLDADKRYRATLRLGIETDSGDVDGTIVATRPVDVTRDDLLRALERFRGPIQQVPPMYSALKRDGQPLYKLARQGIVVDRPARAVTIHALELVAFDGDGDEVRATLDVHCSKGTYVRSLAIDLGQVLGCGAHLTGLRRTAVAELSIDDAVSLATFEMLAPSERAGFLLPVDALIRGLPLVELGEEEARRFLNGQRLPGTGGSSPGRVRVYRASMEGDVLLGTGLVGLDGVLAPARVVAQTPQAPS